ncbi:MAG: hypothetical protein RLZZ628_2930 [Bacteroidota bacterium]|jgi:hypothetical protein
MNLREFWAAEAAKLRDTSALLDKSGLNVNENLFQTTPSNITIGGKEIQLKEIQKRLELEVASWYAQFQSRLATSERVFSVLEDALKKAKSIITRMENAKAWTGKDKKTSQDKYEAYKFAYDTELELIDEVLFRLNLIQNIRLANITNSFARYPNLPQETAFKLGSDYWQVYDAYTQFKPSGFRLKTQINPSTAFNELFSFRNDKKIVVDCSTMLGIIHYRSLQQLLGDQKFDALFINQPVVIGPLQAYYGTEFRDRHPLKRYFNELHVDKLEQLVPGDRVAFANIKSYKGGLWAGEFAIYLGEDEFEGFGAKHTYKGMIKLMKEANGGNTEAYIGTLSNRAPDLTRDIKRFKLNLIK